MQNHFYQNYLYYLQQNPITTLNSISLSNTNTIIPFRPSIGFTQSQLLASTQAKIPIKTAFKSFKIPQDPQIDLLLKQSQLNPSQTLNCSQLTGISHSSQSSSFQQTVEPQASSSLSFSNFTLIPTPIRSRQNFQSKASYIIPGSQSVNKIQVSNTKYQQIIESPQTYYSVLEQNLHSKKQILETTDDLIWKKLMKQDNSKINKRRRNYRQKKINDSQTLNESKGNQESSTKTKISTRTHKINKNNIFSRNKKELIAGNTSL